MSEAVIIAFIVLAALAASLVGLALVRRLASARRLAEHADVVGYVYAVLGVIYAVLLASVVVAAWEEYRDAHTAATDEAAAVLDLARLAQGWPAGERASVEAALAAYARQAVEVEWPAMARGDLGPAAGTATLDGIWRALDEADEAAAAKGASYEAAIAELAALSDARGDRVLLAQEGLPLSMRLILLVGAVVTVAFSYLFAVDDGRVHALLTGSLAGLVALLLLLQFQLARPFHGASAIEPTAMERVLAEIDAGTDRPGATR